MQAIGFYLLLPIIYLFSFLPSFVLRQASSFTYLILYYIVGYRKEVVYQNLRNSFPDKNEKEIDAIAKKFYKIFTDTMFETIKALTASHAWLMKHCSIKNVDVVDEA
ncbi:MAG: lysophospholipid acyltransferase family protein, partial [Chitinophagales bacterium]